MKLLRSQKGTAAAGIEAAVGTEIVVIGFATIAIVAIIELILTLTPLIIPPTDTPHTHTTTLHTPINTTPTTPILIIAITDRGLDFQYE